MLAVCALPAVAQKTTQLPLIGVSINTVASNRPIAMMLRDALAALGEVDGKNIRLDFRLAEGDAVDDVLIDRPHAKIVSSLSSQEPAKPWQPKGQNRLARLGNCQMPRHGSASS